jgi:type I restriction enzyme S subunit
MNKTIKTTLGEVCDFIGGSQPAKKFFLHTKKEGYVRLIQIRDYKTDSYITYIPEESTRKFCNKTDIMIGRYGPPIFQILRGIKGAYNVALMKAIPKNNIANSYLYYFLTQEYLFDYVNALSPRTGGQTGVDVVMLKKFPIQLPELETQKQIAKVLSDLDAKIEINNKINQELEAIAKTLYDYWFVQFDFPDANGKPYKSSGGEMVFNEELKREIPFGWEVCTIENILDKSVRTKKIPSSEYLEKGITPIIDQSTKFICGYTNEEEAIIKAKFPRIVFGDHTRIVKLINFDFARGADGTQVLLSKNERMPQHLFYYSILKIDLSNYGYARHFKFLKDTKIIIPHLELANKFEQQIKVCSNKIKHNTFENQKLSELRDWILPMLMNGQITIGGAEKEMESLGLVAEGDAKYGEE